MCEIFLLLICASEIALFRLSRVAIRREMDASVARQSLRLDSNISLDSLYFSSTLRVVRKEEGRGRNEEWRGRERNEGGRERKE